MKIKNFFKQIKNLTFFKIYKEELIVVPIILFVFWLFNRIVVSLYPDSAFFDYISEIETILSKIVIFIVSLWTAHLTLRMSFPKVYQFLQKEFYFKFDSLDQEKKTNYAIKFILVFIIASALVFSSKAQNTNIKYDINSINYVDSSQINIDDTISNDNFFINKKED